MRTSGHAREARHLTSANEGDLQSSFWGFIEQCRQHRNASIDEEDEAPPPVRPAQSHRAPRRKPPKVRRRELESVAASDGVGRLVVWVLASALLCANVRHRQLRGARRHCCGQI